MMTSITGQPGKVWAAEFEITSPKTDREMLLYLLQQFDGEIAVCGRCSHEEPTADCDSAYALREYLAANP